MPNTQDCGRLALVGHVKACVLQDDLVFLDITRDQYFCLPAMAGVARLSAHRRTLAVDDADLAAELAAAGLVKAGPVSAIAADRTAPNPQRSALPDTVESLRLQDLPQMARCLLDLALHYRGRTFEQLLRQAATPARPPRRGSRRTLDDLLRRFHRWAPYAPVSAKCLLRSFMLLRLLRRHGYDALWVIGVTTWPFAAHCWLQADDVILDEACERAALFQPILVI